MLLKNKFGIHNVFDNSQYNATYSWVELVVECHGPSCVTARTALYWRAVVFNQDKPKVPVSRLLLCTISSIGVAGRMLKQCVSHFTHCLIHSCCTPIFTFLPSPPICIFCFQALSPSIQNTSRAKCPCLLYPTLVLSNVAICPSSVCPSSHLSVCLSHTLAQKPCTLELWLS